MLKIWPLESRRQLNREPLRLNKPKLKLKKLWKRPSKLRFKYSKLKQRQKLELPKREDSFKLKSKDQSKGGKLPSQFRHGRRKETWEGRAGAVRRRLLTPTLVLIH